MIRRAVLFLVVTLGTLLGSTFALAAPELTVRISTTEVEVGDQFTIELKAVDDRGPSGSTDPQLRPPRGLSIVSGPSLSTQTIAQFGSGGSSVKVGVGAIWQLVALKPGRLTIPGPTMTWNGTTLRGKSIDITVVPATGRQRRTQNPFLLPGGPTQSPWPFGAQGNPFDDFFSDDDEAGMEELALPSAPDPLVFLRAITDKTSAVVGEQVTLSFYLYYRESVESYGDPRGATLSDFLRYPLLKDPGSSQPGYTRVGQQRFKVQLLDKMALIPLRAGDLHTGSMSIRLNGRRVGSRALRESNDVVIHVTEPPTDSRPPGYVLGDVGDFKLSAIVQPRQIKQGESVAVTLRVTGTGNLPQSLRPPARTGIEWLDPEKRESIEPRAGVIGGWRSFGYVVKVNKSGTVELGTFSLPFWNPDQKRYIVERAELGTLQVTPNASIAAPNPADTASNTARDPFAGLPPPRKALSNYAPPSAGLPLQQVQFWALLAAPPLLVSLYGAGDRLVRRVRQRRANGVTSPQKLASMAQREADQAAAQGDSKETAAAVERAIHRAIEASTGLKSRGVLLQDLSHELQQKGMPEELAKQASDMLAACEVIRFEPEADHAAAIDLAKRARVVATDLVRWKPA